MNFIKKIAVAITVCVSFVSTTAWAADNTNPIVAANNEAGIAVTGSTMNYQEHFTPAEIARYKADDSETGWMPGFEAKYSLMGDYFNSLPSDMYFAVHYQLNSGNIAYKGALSNGSIYDGTDSATTSRVIARIGKGFQLSNAMMLTPYIAGGYQDWNRHLLGSSGYTEDYRSGLVGAGAMFQYAATQRLVLTANAEMLALVGAGMTPHHVPGLAPGSLGSASFGTSGEEKVGADADYRIYSKWHLYGGLSYTHFNYTGGSLNLGAREPLSSTSLFSMDAGIGYQF
jgi:hypothetical protein